MFLIKLCNFLLSETKGSKFTGSPTFKAAVFLLKLISGEIPVYGKMLKFTHFERVSMIKLDWAFIC